MIAWRLPVIALVASCGRIDFDAQPTDLAIVAVDGIAVGHGATPLESITIPSAHVGPELGERIIVVALAINFMMIDATSIAVTFAGQPMTAIPAASGSQNFYLSLWYAPVVAGEPADVSASWVNGADGASLSTAVIVGADPASPIAGGAFHEGSSVAASIALASAPGHLVFDVIITETSTERSCDDGSQQVLCPGAGEHQLSYDEDSIYNQFATGMHPGAASVSTAWAATGPWTQSIVDIAPPH